MKFTVKKKDILDVLSKIQGITGRKSNLAITTNVLIKADGSALTLTATDLETGFEGTYAAKVETSGTIAINARKLFEIIREYPDDTIHINEVENHWVEIGSDNVMFNIVGMNPEEFPASPQLENITVFDIDTMALKQMIEKTVIISGAPDDKRAHITGVFFHSFKEKDSHSVRMASTDGSRLTTADYDYGKEMTFSNDDGLLIPKKGLVELAKFLDDDNQVQWGVEGNQFIVKKSAETIIIRLLEGEFPQYLDIINQVRDDSELKAINMDRQMFIMMLKRMSILSSENYKGVIFKFDKDRLTVNSTNPDIGESKEDMAIAYDGKPLEIAFNPRYFIDTLNVINEEKIILYIKDEEKPCLIESETDKSFLSVIMPMRI
jgi:DNA polymerase-3 subunit beta